MAKYRMTPNDIIEAPTHYYVADINYIYNNEQEGINKYFYIDKC